MKKTYPFSAYDKFLCLKPSAGIWVSLLFLLRPIVVIALSMADRKNRGELVDLVYADRLALFLATFAAIPAILLLVAFFKRKPGASDRIQNLWKRGREFLMAAALLNIVIVFVPVLLNVVSTVSLIGWAQLAASIGIIVYLYTDERVKDVFDDFPQPSEEDEK